MFWNCNSNIALLLPLPIVICRWTHKLPQPVLDPVLDICSVIIAVALTHSLTLTSYCLLIQVGNQNRDRRRRKNFSHRCTVTTTLFFRPVLFFCFGWLFCWKSQRQLKRHTTWCQTPCDTFGAWVFKLVMWVRMQQRAS